jgi:uncharacterized protein
MRRVICSLVVAGMLACAYPLAVAQNAPLLVQAAKSENWSELQDSLDKGADPNEVYGDGTSALHWASYHDSMQNAEVLLEANAAVNAATDLGVTPLWLAAQNGSEAMVTLLLDAGADPNIASLSGESPLLTAAQAGNVGVVTSLLASGADPNRSVYQDQTALMWAANQGHASIVEALIGYGASVDLQTTTRRQYVKTEKPQDSHPDYKVWVEQGGYTPLMFAVRSADYESTRLLIEAGSDVNAEAADGMTPIVMAAHSGNDQILALLIDSGADINNSSAGHTALHAAILRGNPAAVRVLLKNNAGLEYQVQKATPVRRQSTDYGFHQVLVGATPLWLAARFNEPAIMQQLLDAGADASALNHATYPAQRGLGENYMADEGEISILMAAVGMGHRRLRLSWASPQRRAGITGADRESLVLETAKVAVASGVDLNRQDASGKSALAFARDRRYESVVDYLLATGATE